MILEKLEHVDICSSKGVETVKNKRNDTGERIIDEYNLRENKRE